MLHLLPAHFQTLLVCIKTLALKKKGDKNPMKKNIPSYYHWFHRATVVLGLFRWQVPLTLKDVTAFSRQDYAKLIVRVLLFCFVFFSSLLSKSGQAALGLNTSKKKTHIGSGSLFCGALEENILSPLCKTNTNSLLAWTLFFVDTLL